MVNLITAIVIATSPPPVVQPPCSIVVNKVLDILEAPWSNRQLAPIRVLTILREKSGK